MKHQETLVVGGVDAHADRHHAAALDEGVRVLEVNEPHAHARRRVGKSDPIDAELAARAALAGKADAIPKRTDGIVESIRQLRVARQSAVKARSAAMVQLRDLIVTAPDPLREQLSEPQTIRRPRLIYAAVTTNVWCPRGSSATTRSSSPRLVSRVVYATAAPSSCTDATVEPRGSV
jgi:hypothetical protein